jgi:hypothetical protein
VTFHFGPEGEEGMGPPMKKLKRVRQEKGRQKAFVGKQRRGGCIVPHAPAVYPLEQLFRSNVR